MKIASRNISQICLVCIFSLFTMSSFAQTKKAFIKAAEKALLDKDYHASLTYFQKALRFDSSQVDILFHTAESARNFNSYTTAEKLYEKVVNQDSSNQYPSAQFWLAEMKNKLGKYDEAIQSYNLYIGESDAPENRLGLIAKKQLQSSEWSKSVIETEREDIEVNTLLGSVNTPYSEFGALKINDTLYYSSLRYERESENNEPTRLYSKVLKKAGSGEGEPLDDDLNDPKLHTAHSAFNAAKDRIYFTICDYLNASDIRCDLYYVQKDNDSWSDPVKLPIGINQDSTTSTQPAIGKDKDTGKEVLYFVSDREEGKGGLDIWKATIGDNNDFGAVENVEALNTSFDEITPYYHSPTNTIYFSSMGWQGLGGFDIFRSRQYSKGFGEVKHMGNLINTSYNDVYFSLDESGEKGLISSNRLGSLYLEEAQEACCYDIYEIDFKASKIELLASTFDKNDQSPLAGSTVTLFDLTDPDADPVVIENVDGNDFTFLLEADKDYKVVAVKEGYEPDSALFNTRDIFKNEEISKKLFLKKKSLDLEVLTFDKLTGDPLIGATVTVIDLSDSLNIQTFNNPDGNNFMIPLDRNKKYKVIVSKKGYTPDSFEIDASQYDDQNKVTEKVYLIRGDLESFLPLILFFDNDYPTPSQYENIVFNQLSEDYYNRKNEYYETFSNPLDEDQKTEVNREYDRFFNDRVLKGKVDLGEFLDILLVQLQQGEKLEIFLKGYASPLSSEQYNLRLGERRVVNVKNEINSFKDSSLQQYITSGLLKISQQSFGETTSPEGISDMLSDLRNSIFGIPASSERRVEIVQIKRAEN